jgi:hypothetical protein
VKQSSLNQVFILFFLRGDVSFNSLKSGLLHLTGQPYCKKGRSAKVKDGIRNLILRNYLLDRYTFLKVRNLTLLATIRAIWKDFLGTKTGANFSKEKEV